MRQTKRFIILAITIIGPFALIREAQGTRVGHEGELWLKEKPEARNTYAMGYTLGFQQGVNDVCQAVASEAQNPTPLHGCLSQNLRVPDMSELARNVTQFYERYPSDRYLYITDVMHALGRGMTLEQIHQNATGGGVRPPN